MTEQRQRTERKTEEAAQRRRRADGTIDGNLSKRLHIPENVEARLKADGLTPRWVNDEGNRIFNLTERDDYDAVAGVEPVPVGTSKDGKPIMAHLLAKRNDFILEDRAKAEQRRRETEQGMVGGRIPTPDGNSAPVRGVAGAAAYVDRASSIGRGNQIIE